MPDTDVNDIFNGAQNLKGLSVSSDSESFERYLEAFERFEGTTRNSKGKPSSDRVLAFASGDLYNASTVSQNSLVGIRSSLDKDDNCEKMKKARKYAEQVSLVQELAGLRASLWGRGFEITHPHKAVEQAYRNLADRFKLALSIPLLMQNLSIVTNSALIWAVGDKTKDLAYLNVYNPESTYIDILTNTLWLEPSGDLKKAISGAKPGDRAKYLKTLKPSQRKKAEKLWDSIKDSNFSLTKPGFMPLEESDGEYWQIMMAGGGSSRISYQTCAMQSIFTDIELLKMLIEGDWATAFLLKNMIVIIKAGESIETGPLAGSRRNWAKSKDMANLKKQIDKTGKAQYLYGNHTLEVEFAHPDAAVFSPEKYDSVIDRICTYFGIGKYMLTGASSGSSRGASYSAASWNVQGSIRTKAREIREIVDKQLQTFYEHPAVIDAAFMNSGNIYWHDCFSTLDGHMLKFVDTDFKMLAKENIGVVQYSRNGFATQRPMPVKEVLVDNASIVLSKKIPDDAEPEQFRLFLTGKQILKLLGPPVNRFDERGLKEDRQVLAEVQAARQDGVISALRYAEDLGFRFDEEIAQKLKELEIPELLVPIFEKNTGMVAAILAEAFGIGMSMVDDMNGGEGETGRPRTRPEGKQDTNKNPRPSTASTEEDDADLEGMRTAVWQSMKDVPARLKTLHGARLTLAQVNSIARQAEAAEEGGAKNGWAVARAHFQDTHHIEDGKWVKNKK